jgi:hypothetical protein
VVSRDIEGAQHEQKTRTFQPSLRGGIVIYTHPSTEVLSCFRPVPPGQLPGHFVSSPDRAEKPPILTQSQPCDRPANRDPWFPAQIASR